MQTSGKIFWNLVMMSIFVIMVAIAWDYPPTARFLPFVIGIPGIVLTLLQLIIEIRDARKVTEPEAPDARSEFEKLEEEVSRRVASKVDLDIVREKLEVVVEDRTDKSTSRLHREIVFFSYFVGLVAGVLLFGFWLTIPVFVIIFLRLHERENWMFALSLTGAAWLIIYLAFDRMLAIILHEGFVTTYLIDLLIPD